MIINAQTVTSTILNSQQSKDHQQPNIVLSPVQFQELNRNLKETLKTELQTELRALDMKRSTTDMAALVKAFKEDKNTLHLLTEAVAEAIKGTLKPTIEALAKAAVERNISEAEDKLRQAFTTAVDKFLNDQKSSGLTAQVNKNTKNVDKLRRGGGVLSQWLRCNPSGAREGQKGTRNKQSLPLLRHFRETPRAAPRSTTAS